MLEELGHYVLVSIGPNKRVGGGGGCVCVASWGRSSYALFILGNQYPTFSGVSSLLIWN